MSAMSLKILVVKLADLGDVMTATPALQYLRQTYPQAKIDLLLSHHTQALMAHSNMVDGLISANNFRFFSLREALKPHLLKEALALLRQIHSRKYDVVIILHHLTTTAGSLKYQAIARFSQAKYVLGLRPLHRRATYLSHVIPDEGFGAKHEIDYWLAVVGLLKQINVSAGNQPPLSSPQEEGSRILPPVGRVRGGLMSQPTLSVTPADTAWATKIIKKLGDRPLVVIHPGSGGFSTARRWAAQNFAYVADKLAKQGAKIIIVGTASDNTASVIGTMTHKATDLTGKTSLHQLTALLKEADLYIGGDSGVTHLATASDIPMVTIFGPTNASAWGPQGEERITHQAQLACTPCAYIGHAVGLRQGCEARTCLQLVTPEQVLTSAQSLLGYQKESLPNTKNTALKTGNWKLKTENFQTAKILDVRLHAITFDQTLACIEQFIATKSPHQIVTVNPEFVVTAQKDVVFRQILNRAALAFADGNGLLKAARWLGEPALPERVAGVDIVEALALLSAQKGYKLYFLGAMPGVAEKASEVLQAKYPGCVVVGCFAGSPQAKDEADIVARIQAANPDILLVAYGAPKQDKWIARNMTRLPASVCMGVGGAFDFISGTTSRAPLWMQRANLEWLHRFITQPWRWRRIWNAVPRFMWLVGREKVRNKK